MEDQPSMEDRLHNLESGFAEAARRFPIIEEEIRRVTEAGRRTQEKTIIKPPAYWNDRSKDGGFLVWRQQFEDAIAANRYSTDNAIRAAKNAVRGEASELVSDIKSEEFITLDDFLNAFEARFVAEAEANLLKVDFDQLLQGKEETILAFHARCRTLFKRAYPRDVDDTQLRRRFTLGLRDASVRQHRTPADGAAVEGMVKLINGVCSLNATLDFKSHIPVKLNGVSQLAYLDSGNIASNAISKLCLFEIGLTLKDVIRVRTRVGTANPKAPLDVLGKTKRKICLTIGKSTFYIQPLVIDKLAMKFNLCGPFMARHGMDQIHSTGHLKIRDELIPVVNPYDRLASLDNVNTVPAKLTKNLEKWPKESTNVYADAKYQVPANTMMNIALRVASMQSSNRNLNECQGFVKPEKDLSTRIGVDTFNGFTTVDANGCINILVCNNQPEACLISEGT
ncbi:Hypothetical predicted protein, partial [Paramuricea clavata]